MEVETTQMLDKSYISMTLLLSISPHIEADIVLSCQPT